MLDGERRIERRRELLVPQWVWLQSQAENLPKLPDVIDLPGGLVRKEPGLHVVEHWHAVEILGQVALQLEMAFHLRKDRDALILLDAPVEDAEEGEGVDFFQQKAGAVPIFVIQRRDDISLPAQFFQKGDKLCLLCFPARQYLCQFLINRNPRKLVYHFEAIIQEKSPRCKLPS